MNTMKYTGSLLALAAAAGWAATPLAVQDSANDESVEIKSGYDAGVVEAQARYEKSAAEARAEFDEVFAE